MPPPPVSGARTEDPGPRREVEDGERQPAVHQPGLHQPGGDEVDVHHAGVSEPGDQADVRRPRPLYARLLRLRHTALSRWQAVVLFDGVLVVGVLMALAEVASAWTPVVLPAAVALVVKAYDVVAGLAGPFPPAGEG